MTASLQIALLHLGYESPQGFHTVLQSFDLQVPAGHIASLLGGDARLLYSNCERIQGRVIGQLQVRLSGPLAASALVQDGWVADSILTHPLQAAETTAP